MISLDTFYKDVMSKFDKIDERLDETCGSIAQVDKTIASHLAAEKAVKESKAKVFDKKTVVISLTIGIIGVVAIFK